MSLSLVDFRRLALMPVLGLLLALNACTSTGLLQSQPAEVSAAQQYWSAETLARGPLQLARLGTGTQALGALGVSIRLQASAAYRVLNSTPGAAPAQMSDVQGLRLFLVNAALGTPAGTVAPFPNSGDVFSLSTVAANANVLFTQVPAGSYHVCVAAFNTSTGPFQLSSNLNKPGSTDYLEGPCVCSASGGDGDGKITVSGPPGYTVSNTNPLVVNLELKAASGASLDLSATVEDG